MERKLNLTWIGPAKNGRWAVMARKTPAAPWVQLESCLSEEDARRLVDLWDLNGSDEDRWRQIDRASDDDDWGDDAPLSMKETK